MNVSCQVAVLSCLAVAQAQVGYAGYPAGYGYGYPAGVVNAAAPVAYANAALPAVYGGVYGATYDPSVAYANLCKSPPLPLLRIQ